MNTNKNSSLAAARSHTAAVALLQSIGLLRLPQARFGEGPREAYSQPWTCVAHSAVGGGCLAPVQAPVGACRTERLAAGSAPSLPTRPDPRMPYPGAA